MRMMRRPELSQSNPWHMRAGAKIRLEGRGQLERRQILEQYSSKEMS